MCHHHAASCQSPNVLTELRVFGVPVYAKRQTSLDSTSVPASAPGPTQIQDKQYCQGYDDSAAWSPAHGSNVAASPEKAYHLDVQGQPELEAHSSYLQQVVAPGPDAYDCLESETCKRQHFCQPRLCKKILAKARRALSRLGRTPSKASLRSRIASFPPRHDHGAVFEKPAEGSWTPPVTNPPSAIQSELPDSSRFELPTNCKTHHVAGSAWYHVPSFDPLLHKPVSEENYVISPSTPSPNWSGSGSTGVSSWEPNAQQNFSSYWCTTSTEMSCITSPCSQGSRPEGLSATSQLDCSSNALIGTSCTSPVAGRGTPEGTSSLSSTMLAGAHLQLKPSILTDHTTTQNQGFSTYHCMTDGNFCDSPTSLSPEADFFETRSGENDSEDGDVPLAVAMSWTAAPITEIMSSTSNESTYNPGAFAAGCTNESVMHTSGSLSSQSLDLSDSCSPAMTLCLCHGLPKRPDMQLTDLTAVSTACGVHSCWLAQGDENIFTHHVREIFECSVAHALQKLSKFKPDVQSALAPAFQNNLTIQAGLNALHALHTSRTFLSINELVSLVFLAFSILVLVVDEESLTRYTDALYVDVADWPSALASASDQQALVSLLEHFWLPETAQTAPNNGSLLFCPNISPIRASPLEAPSASFGDIYGLRTGMIARVCQCYVDLVHGAADPKHLANAPAESWQERDQPPEFAHSVTMDITYPYMTASISDTMKEVIASTTHAVNTGAITSFGEVEAHFKSEMIQHKNHFYGHSSSIFAAMCKNAAAMYAARKIQWVSRAICRSANRTVSQVWTQERASPVHRLEQHIGSTKSGACEFVTRSISSEDLNQSTFEVQTVSQPRPKGRGRKSSQGMSSSTCSLCNKVFKHKYHDDHLRRHKNSVHGNKRLTCGYCGRELSNRKDNFRKHQRRCSSKGIQTPESVG